MKGAVRTEMNQRRPKLWYASKARIRTLVLVALRRLEAELQDEDGDWRAALKVVELVLQCHLYETTH